MEYNLAVVLDRRPVPGFIIRYCVCKFVVMMEGSYTCFAIDFHLYDIDLKRLSAHHEIITPST